jgi:hypothetical protein
MITIGRCSNRGVKNINTMCWITVEKRNRGKIQCQPSGWHIFFRRMSYLPYTHSRLDEINIRERQSRATAFPGMRPAAGHYPRAS